jgi:hypothetical protein
MPTPGRISLGPVNCLSNLTDLSLAPCAQAFRPSSSRLCPKRAYSPPRGPEWLHEPKLDGRRVQVHADVFALHRALGDHREDLIAIAAFDL